MLRVVDVSKWQAGISTAQLDCDAVIVKATGGTDNTVNPYWKDQAEGALASGKLLGFYHYAMEYGHKNSPRDEAECFLAQISDYIGQAALFLDWEEDALTLPQSWAREWLDIVADRTGATPFFYCYAGALNGSDFSQLTKYPLWMASYLQRYYYGGWVADPDNIWATGDWDYMVMYQYCSTGRISGWNANLDLSVFYGSAADWRRYAGGAHTMGYGDVAAAIHRDMCEDDDNGYSWSPRKGEDGLGVKTLTIDGQSYSYDRGSWDCSSSTIKAWQEAMKHTKHAHMLDGANTTYDMRAVFLASGLFEWKPMSFQACPGDLYLDEDQHVAMCQSQVPDMLSEFCSNEYGGAYGGQVGDQTGYEAYVHGYYSGNWDGILHYNGKADGEMASGGWKKGKNGKWWYEHSDGSYTTNDWEYIGERWYYFDAEGWMATGWIAWHGEWYYCQPKTKDTGDSYGYMVTGWQRIKWKNRMWWFWFEGDGSMFRSGFKRIGGKWYAFDANGCMVEDAKALTVGKNGAIEIA